MNTEMFGVQTLRWYDGAEGKLKGVEASLLGGLFLDFFRGVHKVASSEKLMMTGLQTAG